MAVNSNPLYEYYKNKKILVTGGTGSIGQQIVATLLQYAPKQIVIFNKDDSKQYLMKQQYTGNHRLAFCLGDIRDYSNVEYITRGIDIVFHAAALKQVPVCEENPFEAVKTNIMGSENLIRACVFNEVKKVVNISTDKAINPSNTMGATKYISEKLFQQANHMLKNNLTTFCSVRFGNVIGSRGSVIPIFMNQLKSNEALTITHPDMTRFFMTIEEAAELTLKAAYYSSKGETFILKMKSLQISELLEAIHLYCKQEQLPFPKTKIVGVRPGEKLHEELMSPNEIDHALEDKELYVVLPYPAKKYRHFKKQLKETLYRSDQIEQVERKQLLSFLYAFEEN